MQNSTDDPQAFTVGQWVFAGNMDATSPYPCYCDFRVSQRYNRILISHHYRDLSTDEVNYLDSTFTGKCSGTPPNEECCGTKVTPTCDCTPSTGIDQPGINGDHLSKY